MNREETRAENQRLERAAEFVERATGEKLRPYQKELVNKIAEGYKVDLKRGRVKR